MLKQNETKVENLRSGNVVSEKLADAMLGKGDEISVKAANSTGGGNASWKDSVDQEYTIVGFDLIESDVRVYKRERPKEFESISKNGGEIMCADGNVYTADGKDTGTPLGEYVTRPIAYVAALVTGGNRSSISVTALQSAARNKWDKNEMKGKTYFSKSAPTPADFVAQYGGELINKTIKLLKVIETNGRFKTTTCIFSTPEEAK